MKTLRHLPFTSHIVTILTALFLVATVSSAQEKKIDRIVVFGSSLSDSGNAFVLLSNPQTYSFDESCSLGTPANTPPYDKLDDFLVPDGSYARGGHHVSNGSTWIEQFARGRGLSGYTRPALGNNGIKASNYAVGGARAVDYPCRFNLSNQLEVFNRDLQNGLVISEKTLFVFEIGGNDVRDALVSGSLEVAEQIITQALGKIGDAITLLYSQGARKFLLVNVPAIGETPAVKIIDAMMPGAAQSANALSQAFNNNLEGLQGFLNGMLPGVDIKTLDLYAMLNDIIANPETFGLSNIKDACVTPNVAPFTCKNPDSYLFWDGIHPTKVVHGIMAQKAAEVLND